MSRALILIDMQRDFASPDGAMARQGHDMTRVPGALDRAQVLAASARRAHVPVIFVRLIADAVCVSGTPGADFVGVQPQAGEAIFTKARYSAFTGTGLGDHLRRHGITMVVLAGLTTDCCIQASAWAAFEEGLSVVIAVDACAAYDKGLHDAALRALQASGAVLMDSENLAQDFK